ncbi:DoxX family protein [Paracraurococcus lichenis]|uniref:DoxX family protein n=1 Tax=Paracraurococcus lichenis TaxID=3064888 RepID=A0ABT9DTM8_9PROT|nr:DoxX family protein [Paracraurococcus sp. LOR1-02]MDO9707251.1 DoxX family protein [Paracraurococcus sp. LOR1-02]
MTTTADRALRILAWIAALWIAYEFLWYEQYKLAGPTLVFDRLSDWSGIPEKPFRLFVASMEICAAVLVLIPRTRVLGAAFAMGIMSGAIVFHLFTPLTVDPYGDGGKLFKEACFTWVMAGFVLFAHRREALDLLRRYAPRIGARIA